MERILSTVEWDAKLEVVCAELTRMKDPAYAPSLVQLHETLQKFYSLEATVRSIISQLQLSKLTAEEQRHQKAFQDFEDHLQRLIDATAQNISNRTETPESEYAGRWEDSSGRGFRQVAEPLIATRQERQPAAPDHPRSSTPYAIRYPRGT